MDRRSNTGRRWWGAAVVVAVLLAALVGRGVAGTPITGSAQRAALPGPPSVGDCLQAAPTVRGAAFDSPRSRVFSARTGPCADANFGEVVSVQDIDSFRGSHTDRSAVLDPGACQQPAADYLGWAAPESEPHAAGTVSWQPAVWQDLALLGPDAAEFGAGQRWLSCILLPRLTPYAGSVRGSRPGPAVDALGSCRPTANETADPSVACGEPHISEVFGIGTVGPAQVPELLQACRQLISSETGLTDPAAAGALSIWVEVGGSGDGPPRSGGDAGSSTGRCTASAAGGRQLNASLLGVGDGPLPLVS
jgi:hypothetical protein